MFLFRNHAKNATEPKDKFFAGIKKLKKKSIFFSKQESVKKQNPGLLIPIFVSYFVNLFAVVQLLMCLLLPIVASIITHEIYPRL